MMSISQPLLISTNYQYFLIFRLNYQIYFLFFLRPILIYFVVMILGYKWMHARELDTENRRGQLTSKGGKCDLYHSSMLAGTYNVY